MFISNTGKSKSYHIHSFPGYKLIKYGKMRIIIKLKVWYGENEKQRNPTDIKKTEHEKNGAK